MRVETKLYENSVQKELVEKIKSLIEVEHLMDWRVNTKKGILYHDICKDGKVLSKLFQDVSPIVMATGLPIGEIKDISLNYLLDTKDFADKENYEVDEPSGNYYTIIYFCDDFDSILFVKEYGENNVYEPKEGSFVVFDSTLEHIHYRPERFKKGNILERRKIIKFLIKK